MDELVALLQIIDHSLLDRFSGNSKLLVEGILSGKYRKREDIDLFSGKNKAILISQLFSKVRSKLVSFVIVTSADWLPERHLEVKEDAWKKFAYTQVMIGKGKRRLVVKFQKQLLKLAVDYGFADLAVLVAKDLMYASGLGKDRKSFLMYEKVMNESSDLLRLEQKILSIYLALEGAMRKQDFDRVELDKDFISSLDANKLSSSTSFTLFMFIKVWFEMRNLNYHEAIDLCSLALGRLRNLKGSRRGQVFAFYLRRSLGKLALMDFGSAYQDILEGESLFSEFSYNVVVVRVYKLVNLIHAERYQDAFDEYSGFDNKGYLDEWFKLIGAYLSFIEDKGIRVAKFVNEVPEFSKDRTGFNLIVIGVQLLHLIRKGNFDRVIDRLESLGSMKRKYLNSEASRRSKIFVKMLLELIPGNFNRINVERRTSDLFNKLVNQKMEIPPSLEIEIVRFDQIWNEILKLLGDHTNKM
ncbi:MAG: hypothetical protein AAF731_07775 [Bacteroidota bacterium]